ncbi:hypothetical protein K491DRAFT_432946 [Lophiostoma macrostomum CBS 122681]|uniref:Uncharacterized protein n=1 Tax=Lophiostoma macrostomum CBS 122681 TaxID=1314788 RepID=A0A6A6T5J3_9PLEO|nr:hypothetical protein K491DRAFT_432946 [Lophiostoma macrostomum CBS 122681]
MYGGTSYLSSRIRTVFESGPAEGQGTVCSLRYSLQETLRFQDLEAYAERYSRTWLFNQQSRALIGMGWTCLPSTKVNYTSNSGPSTGIILQPEKAKM